MKQKFISLALAVMLLLGVTGCAMSTPASVGSISDFEAMLKLTRLFLADQAARLTL